MDATNETPIDLTDSQSLKQIIDNPHPLYNFPENLREQPRWILWRLEKVPKKEKPTKVPYSVKGYKASSVEIKDWDSFINCFTSLCENELDAKARQKFNGIGYVFAGGITGIDLDNCFYPPGTMATGKLKPWAEAIYNLFPSYTEKSPSGNGLHIFLATEANFKGVKKYIYKDALDDSKNEVIETYSNGRYFTVTGNVYEHHNLLNSFETEKVLTWVESLMPKVEAKTPTNMTVGMVITPLPADTALLEAIGKKRNGTKFRKLYYSGDWAAEGYGSQSEADMALVSILMFFCRNDTVIVDRLFRNSKLMRDKWDRVDYRDGIFSKCAHTEIMDWSKPNSDQPEDQLVFRNLANIISANVQWLWTNRLAKGKLALWQGEPGQGKSQITINVASILSNGGKLPDNFICEQGDTLFITAEDEASDTIVPRLMAAGADLKRTNELQWLITREGKKILFNFDKYLPQLKQAVTAMNDLKLIVVDPISAFLGKVDGNASGEVRGLLYELKMLAEERNCSVILVLHNNKTPGQRALSRASGSNAFGAAVRLGHVFGPMPKEQEDEFFRDSQVDEKIFVMASTKNNLGPMPSSLLYKIVGVEVWEERNQTTILTSKIEWLGEASYSAQEIVDYMPQKRNKPGRPADLFEECLKKFTELANGRALIETDGVQYIMEILSLAGFKEPIIKKAQKEAGYITVVINGKYISWQKA